MSNVAQLPGKGPILMGAGEKERGGRLCWWVGAVLLVPVLLVGAELLLPSVLLGFRGGFRIRESLRAQSPDGRNCLVVTRRFAFPANELFDPSIVVFFDLRDQTTGRLIDAARLDLEEDSDFREADVWWESATVRVTGMDERHRSAEVRLKRR